MRISFFLSFLFSFSFSLLSSQVANTLKILPDNPRYLTNNSGQPIYLTGSHTWFLLHQDISDPDPPPLTHKRMEDFLDFVESYGHNFVRLWCGGWGYLTHPPYAWKRSSEPGASDGGNKFDLMNFNQAYFDTLKVRVRQITSRNMYCSVMLFGSGIGLYSNWQNNIWYPDNHINLLGFSITDVNSFYTADEIGLQAQHALIRKIIDELNEEDNIFWEIINEGRCEGITWQNDMVDFIRHYEAGKPKKHLISMNLGGQQGSFNSMLYDSHADIISPTIRADNYINGGPAAYTDKVVLVDTDHIFGFSDPVKKKEIRKSIWKTFLRGHHPIFMDAYDDYLPKYGNFGTINPIWNSVRKTMGYTRNYACKMDLANLVPSESSILCSTTYCLYNPGQEYLVYQPDSTSFSLSLVAKTYSYEWFNPKLGILSSTGTITTGSGNQTFTAPFMGEAVLYLKARK